MQVAKRKKFTEYVTQEQVERFAENIKSVAEFIEPESHLEAVDDPKDDIVINTAIDGRAVEGTMIEGIGEDIARAGP
jgi:putative PIN family toxin of toxin-antitoxin system